MLRNPQRLDMKHMNFDLLVIGGGSAATNDKEIARLNGIYRRLLENAGATIFDARESFIDAHTLDVGGQRITTERIVIATGGHPTRLDIPGAEHAIVSDDAFFSRPSSPLSLNTVAASAQQAIHQKTRFRNNMDCRPSSHRGSPSTSA